MPHEFRIFPAAAFPGYGSWFRPAFDSPRYTVTKAFASSSSAYVVGRDRDKPETTIAGLAARPGGDYSLLGYLYSGPAFLRGWDYPIDILGARLVIPLAVPVFLWGLFEVASKLPREFPVETFEDLARRVVTLNQQKLAREAGGSTIDQAWAAFRELLSGASGIASASITRDMRFPEDLGIL